MTKNNDISLLIWQAITPVHSGTGQSGSNIIDLPIAREGATNFPILPASSIKGVLRDGVGLGEDKDKTEITEADQLYGYVNKKTGKKDDQGNDLLASCTGQLTFTDARLLCLPVRSYQGTFAYVTCPLVIQRLKHDLESLGVEDNLPQLPDDLPAGHVHITGNTLQTTETKEVLFEDIDLAAQECAAAKQIGDILASWTGRENIKNHLAVVPNDIFTYFSETATEVTAHIALNPETKTVMDGALWYEETLPAESILSSFLIKGQISFIPPQWLQIGGKGTVGKGLLSIKEAQL